MRKSLLLSSLRELQNKEVILLLALFAMAFFVRLYNLNYNSPFSDEALYVVVGKLGIFQHDWFSYNAKIWMGGLSYVSTRKNS